MNAFFTDVRETLFPRGDGKDGPLPPLLVAMTLVTGLVDAFSYLVLGHVFVANMTGNVLFIAFALAGEHGFSITSSLIAMGSFVLGSLEGGILGSRFGDQRGRLLWTATEIQALLLGFAVILTLLAGNPVPTGYSYPIILALGISMGLQNATARKLGVPDLTTTVLTLTITGMVADSRMAGGNGSKAGRRLISVLAMFAGALLGVLTILHVSIVYPLVIALIIIVLVSLTSRLLSRKHPAWISK
jgi:uncharacterized membrane protein YoaK (UPF0700 family)